MTGDLISREAVLDEIRDIWCRDCHCATTKRDCAACNIGDLISRMKDLPAVDAVPVVHAHWIVQDNTYTRFMCSACETKNHHDRTDYCPHCGAKMDGAVE